MRSFTVLVRHASTEASQGRRLLGSLDEPLSEEGIGEANELAQAMTRRIMETGNLSGWIFSSGLRRAVQTAECISRLLGWPLVTQPKLAERHFGKWSGQTLDRVLMYDPKAAEQFIWDPLSVDPEGAELAVDFRVRVLEAWNVISDLSTSGIGVVVTHDGPIRIILRAIGLTSLAAVPLYSIKPCACFCICKETRHWQFHSNWNPLPEATPSSIASRKNRPGGSTRKPPDTTDPADEHHSRCRRLCRQRVDS